MFLPPLYLRERFNDKLVSRKEKTDSGRNGAHVRTQPTISFCADQVGRFIFFI